MIFYAPSISSFFLVLIIIITLFLFPRLVLRIARCWFWDLARRLPCRCRGPWRGPGRSAIGAPQQHIVRSIRWRRRWRVPGNRGAGRCHGKMAQRYPLSIPDDSGGMRWTLERAHPSGREAAARISAARARAFSFITTMVGVR
jgi:hypothetical protein